MDCSTNSQLPHSRSSNNNPRLTKHGSSDQLLHASLTNKFKVKKKESYAMLMTARRKDSTNAVPKLEDCLISFSIATTDSDVDEEEEPLENHGTSSLDYLRRPYARLPNVPRPSGTGFPMRKSTRPPRKSISGKMRDGFLILTMADDDIASTFKRSFSTEDLVFPLSSRSIDDPTSIRLPSVRELIPVNSDVKPSEHSQYDNVTLQTVSTLQSSLPIEDQLLNRLTSKFMQFGTQKHQTM